MSEKCVRCKKPRPPDATWFVPWEPTVHLYGAPSMCPRCYGKLTLLRRLHAAKWHTTMRRFMKGAK